MLATETAAAPSAHTLASLVLSAIEAKKESAGGVEPMNVEVDSALSSSTAPAQLPDYTLRFNTTLKSNCRVVQFSRDGVWAATGAQDGSLRVLDVAKMLEHKEVCAVCCLQLTEARVQGDKLDEFALSRPVLRNYFDHNGAVNELDFHPVEPFLASCSKVLIVFCYLRGDADWSSGRDHSLL